MKKTRKYYTPKEKVTILRRHLIDRIPVSDVCEEQALKPTVFYRWQKQFFENGSAAFEKKTAPHQSDAEKKIATLEAKLIRKNEVLGELMEEHIQLKKNCGEL